MVYVQFLLTISVKEACLKYFLIILFMLPNVDVSIWHSLYKIYNLTVNSILSELTISQFHEKSKGEKHRLTFSDAHVTYFPEVQWGHRPHRFNTTAHISTYY